jgi:hypothetical protein
MIQSSTDAGGERLSRVIADVASAYGRLGTRGKGRAIARRPPIITQPYRGAAAFDFGTCT